MTYQDAAQTDEEIGAGLSPCPFCGGPSRCVFVTGMAFDFWCGCEPCNVYVRRRCRDDLGTRDYERRAAAAAGWNKRTQISKIERIQQTLTASENTIVRLARERDDAREQRRKWQEASAQDRAEIARLQDAKRRALAIADERGKENDRLQAALRKITRLTGYDNLPDAWVIANEALKDNAAEQIAWK